VSEPRRSRRSRWRFATLLLAVVVLASGCAGSTSSSSTSGGSPSVATPRAAPPAHLPHVRHVFVVNLENHSYDDTFGADSKAPYLARQLTAQGLLLRRFYGIAHHSLPNYLAQISGQAPTADTREDCHQFTEQQGVGQGCVYPASVRTLPGQLASRGLTWRGYMEDMGTPCRHPSIGGPDTTSHARPGDQYAARHDPFVYFHSIIDSAACRRDVVDLDRLSSDLSRTATTRNLTYITPNLCNDGHDSPCVDGSPGGLTSADAWLRQWVPDILASPAYRRNGLLVITFDEAEKGGTGADDACCGQTGPGGGRVGAVLLSPFLTPGTTSDQPYNHYSLEHSLARIFGVRPLGHGKQAPAFGSDVWSGS
jgi:hypothetical protein